MDGYVPDWLDHEFVRNALKDDVEIVKLSVRPAMAPGNNYLSYMYRVRVDYKRDHEFKNVSLMVKAPFAVGFMKELSEQNDFFSKEPQIYNDLLPILNKMACCEFGPKSLPSLVKDVLVITDLKEEDYFLCDKIQQLDFCHSKVVMEKIAKFHAASVVCLNNNKKLIGEIGKDNFFVDGSPIAKMAEQSLKNMLKITSADDRYVRLADFITNRYDAIWPSCSKLTKPKLGHGFNVLNHGDLWVNNMLFKYNSCREVVDVKFIDYQLTRVGSPVNDVVYFIWTSADEEVRSHRQNELLSIYWSTLNKTLAALGCDERLLKQELRDDVTRSVDFVVFVISLPISLMMASPADAPEFEHLMDEDFETEKFHKVFKGKTFNRLLPKYFQQVTEFFLDDKIMVDDSS